MYSNYYSLHCVTLHRYKQEGTELLLFESVLFYCVRHALAVVCVPLHSSVIIEMTGNVNSIPLIKCIINSAPCKFHPF